MLHKKKKLNGSASKKKKRSISRLHIKPGNDGKVEFVAISNCPRCRGAVFRYDSEYRSLSFLYQCFQCARLYVRVDGRFELWVKRPEDLEIKDQDKERKVVKRNRFLW
jgi:hypothetical protein